MKNALNKAVLLHIGVKLINAIPMTRQEYNDFRGWTLPADENGDDKGFLVEYLDGGKANTEEFAGYVSWSPEEVFNNAYRPTTGMNFGLAIEALKLGKKVARKAWNPSTYDYEAGTACIEMIGDEVRCCFLGKDGKDRIINDPGNRVSYFDIKEILVEDWEIIE